MAARKAALNTATTSAELNTLLERARKSPATEEQLIAQRASFAYGNAPASEDRITKESARNAATRQRLIPEKA